MKKYFDYNNTRIGYNIAGQGKAVVLIHGFAEDSAIWHQQFSFLQQYYLTIVPDLPGSGSSQSLNSQKPGIEDFAKVINGLLENEGIESAVIIGHSMGGYITLAFAELFAAKLAGFGFVNSTAFADSEEKKFTRAKSIEFIEEHGVYTFLKNTTPNLFSQKFRNEKPGFVNDLIEQGQAFTKETLTQYYRAMIDRPDRTETLIKSKVPVLFVIGMEDKAAPLDDLLQQVHLPGISDIHILPEVAHMSMLERPDELNSKLQHFLNLT